MIAGRTVLVHARRAAVVALAALTACSGGGGSGGDAGDATTPTAATDVVAPVDSPPSTEPAAPETTDPPASTTTTTTPPAVVPVGARWDGPIPVSGGIAQSAAGRLSVIDGEIWMTGRRWNSSLVFRSSDQGLTWTEVAVEAPASSGTSTVNQIVRGPGGRYVAIGDRESDCLGGEVYDGIFRGVSVCRRVRPVIHLSDDGITWRQLEPGAMAPPSGGSSRLNTITATPDGFLVAGTSRSADWHTVIWSSPDGENWTKAREIRGASGPISPTQLLTDGDTVVLLAEEHPCSTPRDNRSATGWLLGVSWANHLRIFSGTTPEDLVLQNPGDHPLAPEPYPVDCANILESEFSGIPYPQAIGSIVGGDIVILEQFVTDTEREAVESDDPDIDSTTIGSRRLARLTDGQWETITIEGVRSALLGGAGVGLLDVDGEPGIYEVDRYDDARVEFMPIMPTGDGSYEQIIAERPVIGEFAPTAVWLDGVLVAGGFSRPDPYGSNDPFDPIDIQAWRSVEGLGEPVVECDLVAGGVCQFADLSTVDGYPDFNGIDLSGVDLSFTDLGAGEFAGANFTGATLWGVRSEAESGSTFAGANFTEARAQDAELTDVSGAVFVGTLLDSAELGSAVGADFTLARLDAARVDDASGAVFNGASLRTANLGFVTPPDLAGANLDGVSLQPLPQPGTGIRELSVAGLDLTNAAVRGDGDDDRVVITDITGTILSRTTFYAVDLTRIDPATDLTEARVWNNSLCPDGLPPDDGPIGTCVRT